jgi:hypothetical protein
VFAARTAIGLSRDARRRCSPSTPPRRHAIDRSRFGLTGDYAVEALNLDGGGSTTMAMTDPVSGIASIVNASSDNPAGRRVGSSLAVFAPPLSR